MKSWNEFLTNILDGPRIKLSIHDINAIKAAYENGVRMAAGEIELEKENSNLIFKMANKLGIVKRIINKSDKKMVNEMIIALLERGFTKDYVIKLSEKAYYAGKKYETERLNEND